MVNMGNTKVLLSCRMHIMKDSHLQRLKLFTSNECNLHTEKNCLLKKERIMIAERYLNSSEVKEISDIMNLYEFFPLLCKWYAKNKKPSIGDFFQNPVDIFKQNIVEMKEDPNRIQYCAFVLCLLHNGSLHEQWFEIGSDHESTLQSICEEFGIDFRIKRKILQEQLDRLESTFIKKVNRNYYIVHDKVYDVAVAICGQDLVECFIEYTDSIFIGDRYQLESIDTCLDETIIRIPKTHEDRYFQRLLKDLECGHIYSSFQNRQLQNQKFRDKLIAFMRRNKCIVRNILKKFDELQLRLIESRQQTEDFISLSAEESDHLSSDEGSDHSSSDEGSDHSSFGEDRDHSSFDEDTKSDNIEAQRPRRNKQNTNQICPSDDQDFPLPLLESSVQGHEDVVQMLINFGCNVNVFDKFRRTALFLAASHGHRSTVEILLQSNCNSSLCDVWERSPFYVACQEGHSEIVKLLLKVSDISKSDTCYFKTPLHVASEFGHFMIVKMLLENGSSIFQCNTDGHSPLFVACERGHTQLVQLLLAYSSDINQRDEKDKTPLFIACENGYSEVVKILLDHEANISLCNSDGLSPIHVACKWGHTNTVTILMEKNADINRLDRLYGRTPLFLAVEGHYSEIIELLVKNGCDIFTCDKRKQSPLYVACKTGQTSIVKLLLEHMDEYYVLSFNYSEWSPLIAACEGGYDSIVQMLLERNFYINIRDRNVKCPIHIACENGFTDIMTTLLSHDCEVDCLDGDSRSALLIACENGYSDIAKLLLENKANLLLTDEDNWSPFQVACYEGHADIVELLIQYNAETMQCDDKNRSPLFIACMKGHSSVVELLLSTNRADVNQSDVRKWTPLHIASKEGHRDVVKVLLKYGAEKNLPNDTGRSPLDLACSSFRTAIVQLLDVDTSSND
ncbi:unnamed protein product [Mytilus coruscus]|uniref:Uncharacterized protein n=1 Tax=Mytilus coruscus TaxID=42192 RepID=A0A6J8DHF0_MYTCO|nr:unnamed protein product [Mytilus coruscus]